MFFLEASLPLVHQRITITSPLLFALAPAAHVEQANINLHALKEFWAQLILQHWAQGGNDSQRSLPSSVGASSYGCSGSVPCRGAGSRGPASSCIPRLSCTWRPRSQGLAPQKPLGPGNWKTTVLLQSCTGAGLQHCRIADVQRCQCCLFSSGKIKGNHIQGNDCPDSWWEKPCGFRRISV